MVRHLVLRLASPLIAFGGETIDNHGVIRDFPALSMMTGLIANALGWDRSEDVLHNRLQQRLQMGTVLAPGSQQVIDFQTAQIEKKDVGWTTWGQPESRDGGEGTYVGPHLRYRHYHAELTAWIVLQLDPADETPTLDEVASALDRPARPLFIGRKGCLPTTRLVAGWQKADHVLGALQSWVRGLPAGAQGWRAQWPQGHGTLPSDRCREVCDERDWTSGVHGGWRSVREGLIVSEAAK